MLDDATSQLPSDLIGETPAWLRDIHRFLPIVPQFLLTGNINDQYLIKQDGFDQGHFLPQALWFLLKQNGFDALLLYDRFDYFQTYEPTPEAVDAVWRAAQPELPDRITYEQNLANQPGGGHAAGSRALGSDNSKPSESDEEKRSREFWEEGRFLQGINDLPTTLRNIVTCDTAKVAVLVMQASRLLLNSQQISASEGALFGALWKLANDTNPLDNEVTGRQIFTPIFWAVDQANDLPDWFVVGNERLRLQSIQKPDFSMRVRYANSIYKMFSGHDDVTVDQRDELLKLFASQTEGMSLASMESIAVLAVDLKTNFTKLNDAVIAFKLGVTEESPWRSKNFKARIATAQTSISNKIAGQNRAIAKTIDILCRSAIGLSGAHTSDGNSAKPQGVLFFAGPTGTGKTQLAKEITTLLFGNENAYIRFDMSEFAMEHSESRLIGAPPGYAGYDAGGQLTRAIRERPVCVLLFDEIEKAHGRILDKFLQILDDGRLTDNRGNTVYFSEALIIFTSNLGIYTEEVEANGLVKRFQNVEPGQPYHFIETTVKAKIEEYFKYKLQRPEILNRIGDNIVVFDFISEAAAQKIFKGMIDTLIENTFKKERIKLEIVETALDQLRQIVITDKVRANGGRGIANQIESCLINPLSRALFQADYQPGNTIAVTEFIALQKDTQTATDTEEGGAFKVTLRVTA